MRDSLREAFALNLLEARGILEAVRDIVRENDVAVEQSRRVVRESREMLDRLDHPGRPEVSRGRAGRRGH